MGANARHEAGWLAGSQASWSAGRTAERPCGAGVRLQVSQAGGEHETVPVAGARSTLWTRTNAAAGWRETGHGGQRCQRRLHLVPSLSLSFFSSCSFSLSSGACLAETADTTAAVAQRASGAERRGKDLRLLRAINTRAQADGRRPAERAKRAQSRASRRRLAHIAAAASMSVLF